MAFPSVTHTFTNSTTADATQVNTNFTDLINGLSDTTKDLSISALTLAGALTINAAVTLGVSTGNDITFNGSIASSIPVKTNTSFDVGTSIIGLRSIYFGGSSTFTTRIIGGTQTGSLTLTLPITAGTNRDCVETDGSGVLSFKPHRLSPGDARSYSLANSVGASALTVTLNYQDGTAPSATQPIDINFRNLTSATGTTLTRTVSGGALTLVVPSTATMGMASGVAAYLWVYAIDNAGTVELAIAGVRFDEGTVRSSTTISTGADSSSVLYSTTARTNVPIRLLGRLNISEATAGTWASVATEVSLAPAILAMEAIHLRYTNANGQTLTNNTEDIITTWTKDYDTHNAFNATTGLFTAPFTTRYKIQCTLMIADSAWQASGAGGRLELRVQKNAVANTRTLKFWNSGQTAISVTFNLMIEGTDSIALVAGDTLAISVYYSDANGHALNATDLYNWLTIEKIV